MTNPLTKADIVARYLPTTLSHATSATAFAPSNIALCKYWGKRDAELNLPINASLSISLGNLGTSTTLSSAENGIDSLSLNGKKLSKDNPFYQKVFAFIDLFRRKQHLPICIATTNTIPTAAGLASSASGFAALTLAIDKFFNLNLPLSTLSAFARMGSGSASRSLYTGFVEWHKGTQDDGMDSYAEAIDSTWQDFRIGIVQVSSEEKKINSRQGMNRTVNTSMLYSQWQRQAEHDLEAIRNAIIHKDFTRLGETAEHNALSMHATMISAFPPVLYWQPESVAVMHKVWQLRDNGTPAYLTMDAGPNVKLLFLQQNTAAITKNFTPLKIIAPFANAK